MGKGGLLTGETVTAIEQLHCPNQFEVGYSVALSSHLPVYLRLPPDTLGYPVGLLR